MCEGNSAAGRRRSTRMLPERGGVVLLQECFHCEVVVFLGWGGCRHKFREVEEEEVVQHCQCYPWQP